MGKGFGWTLVQRWCPAASKLTKVCSTSLVTRETHVQTAVTEHPTLCRTAVTKNVEDDTCRGDMEERDPHTLLVWMQNGATKLRSNLAVEVPYDPAIPLPRVQGQPATLQPQCPCLPYYVARCSLDSSLIPKGIHSRGTNRTWYMNVRVMRLKSVEDPDVHPQMDEQTKPCAHNAEQGATASRGGVSIRGD